METTIYILRLTDNNWYIGRTGDFPKRWQEHLEGKGSAWTKKFPPVLVESVLEGMSPFDEDRITKEYMAKYGIEKVRGGTYVSVQLDEETVAVLTKEIRNANNLCTRCGRSGHFVGSCYAGTDVNGKKLVKLVKEKKEKEVKEKPEKKEEQLCTRCGRNNHPVGDCKYKTTVDRKKIVDFTALKPSAHLCSRCGRNTHSAENCHCKTTIDGRRLDQLICSRCGRDSHTAEKCYAKTYVHGAEIDESSSTESSSSSGPTAKGVLPGYVPPPGYIFSPSSYVAPPPGYFPPQGQPSPQIRRTDDECTIL